MSDWIRLYSNFSAGIFVDWRASDDSWRVRRGDTITHCTTSEEAQRLVDAALSIHAE